MKPKSSVLTLFLALFSTVTIHPIAHNLQLSDAHIHGEKSQNPPPLAQIRSGAHVCTNHCGRGSSTLVGQARTRTLDKTERPPPCFPQENKEAVRSEAWMWDVEQQMLAMAGT